MIPYMQGLPDGDTYSDNEQTGDFAPWSFIYYDDTYLGGGTPPTPPTAPSGLTANQASNSVIALAWTDNSADEDYFEVQRSTDNTNWLSSVQLPANTTSYNSVGLTGNTLYYYRVRAGSNANGTSAWATASDTTDPDEVVPPPPTVNKRRPKRSGAAAAGGPL